MNKYPHVLLFSIILFITIISLISSFTGHQIIDLPQYRAQTIFDCPLSVEIKDYSPDNLLLKNPLITGMITSELCQESGPYHIKIKDKIYPKYSCQNEKILTYRSCYAGEISLHGVLTPINLTQKNYKNGFYEGSWRCPQGQECTVEKRNNDLFNGCEDKIDPVSAEIETPTELNILEQSCNLEITYVDFKTEISVKSIPGKKSILIQFGEKKGIKTELELKEKENGIYSRTLIFREPKIYEFKYAKYIIPVEVIQAPKDLKNRQVTKIYQKAIKKLKTFFLNIVD